MPSSAAIENHFGCLLQAYQRIGYTCRERDIQASGTNKRTRRLRDELIEKLLKMFPGNLSIFRFSDSRRVNIYMDGYLPISVLLCRTVRTPLGNIRWQLVPAEMERENVTLLCRLNAENDGFHSLYVLSSIGRPSHCRLRENDPWLSLGVRLENLEQFYDATKRIARDRPRLACD